MHRWRKSGVKFKAKRQTAIDGDEERQVIQTGASRSSRLVREPYEHPYEHRTNNGENTVRTTRELRCELRCELRTRTQPRTTRRAPLAARSTERPPLLTAKRHSVTNTLRSRAPTRSHTKRYQHRTRGIFHLFLCTHSMLSAVIAEFQWWDFPTRLLIPPRATFVSCAYSAA